MQHQNKRLRIFTAIIDTGSFTAAAEKLGITQPNVSLSLAQLEAETGKLINRQSGYGGFHRLTDTGKLIYSLAKQIQAIEDRIEKARGAA